MNSAISKIQALVAQNKPKDRSEIDSESIERPGTKDYPANPKDHHISVKKARKQQKFRKLKDVAENKESGKSDQDQAIKKVIKQRNKADGQVKFAKKEKEGMDKEDKEGHELSEIKSWRSEKRVDKVDRARGLNKPNRSFGNRLKTKIRDVGRAANRVLSKNARRDYDGKKERVMRKLATHTANLMHYSAEKQAEFSQHKQDAYSTDQMHKKAKNTLKSAKGKLTKAQNSGTNIPGAMSLKTRAAKDLDAVNHVNALTQSRLHNHKQKHDFASAGKHARVTTKRGIDALQMGKKGSDGKRRKGFMRGKGLFAHTEYDIRDIIIEARLRAANDNKGLAPHQTAYARIKKRVKGGSWSHPKGQNHEHSDVTNWMNERVKHAKSKNLTSQDAYEDYCDHCNEHEKEPHSLTPFSRVVGEHSHSIHGPVRKAKVSGRVRMINLTLK